MESVEHKLRNVLAANMQRARFDLGLSQEALADLAGLHRTYVGSVERRERNISIDNIEKLAAALGMTAAQLLTDYRVSAPVPTSVRSFERSDRR